MRHVIILYSIIKKSYRFGNVICLLFVLSGCKKFVEVDPPVTVTTGESVYTTDATAAAVLTGIYTQMSQQITGVNSISIKAGLSADEFNLYGSPANLIPFYINAITTVQEQTFWERFYKYLQTINSAIEGISNSTTLSSSVQKQLVGEAKFLRAFFLFYLTNMHGDIPIVTSSDYQINNVLARSPLKSVYGQIISDLLDAKDNLSSNYVNNDALSITTERVRPNKFVASALLARVYLYNNDWINAENEAASVINNPSLYDTTSVNNVFNKNSKEALWQLQPVNTGSNTEEAKVFILTGSPNTSKPIYLSSFLLNNFELGDKRRIIGNWINSITSGGVTYYYPFKYKISTSGLPVTEYYMVMRLSEQYLIRAEARAQQNNIIGSKGDLNVIRTRAGLPLSTVGTKDSLLAAIFHERQVELFSEWGHRWFDLKRTGAIDSVMAIVTPKKGGTWNKNWQLYPLPIYDIQQNPNLKQNPGY